jgi:outer membrane receptor protein involved in Fe transport
MALDHVDVLRDGASPIYGSDAVAGVVNWVTKINFQGAELDFHYGDYEHGGEESTVSGLIGGKFDGNKGRYILEFDNYHREYIALGTRSYLADADASSQAPLPFNGESGQQAYFSDRFQITDFGEYTVAAPNGSFPSQNNFYLVPNSSGGVSIITSVPSHTGVQGNWYGNQNLIYPLMPRTDRDTLYARIEYDLSQSVTAFGEFNLHRAESTQYRNDLPYFGVELSASNPFNPYGTSFFDPNGAPTASGSPRLVGTPEPILIEEHGTGDYSPVQPDQTYDTEWRALAGLRGKLLSDNWNWEAVALYSRATVTDYEQGFLYQPLVNILTNGIYNPIGYNFAVQNNALVVTSQAANPPNSLDSASTPFIRWGYTSLADFNFRTSGTIFRFEGNPISLALGVEARHDEAENNQPADATGNSFLDYGRTVDLDAQRTVGGEFAELFAPVLTPQNKIPFVTEFDLDAAARTEEYSDVGDSGVKPKFGADWKPFPWLLIRASYNEGFVAPGLQAINEAPSTGGNEQNPDPYSLQETPLYRNTVTGNHNLKPANSEGKSAGVVIDIPHVKGLSFSIDHWEISEKNVVVSPSSLADDSALLLAATQKELAAGVPLTQINLGSGTSGYQGSPLVVRNAVTPADIAYFAQLNAGLPAGEQRAVVGTVASTYGESINRALEVFKGDDINITYETPEFAVGRFKFTSDWVYMETAYGQNEPGQPFQQGLYIGQDPRIQGLSTFTWMKSGWEIGVSDQYIGHLYDPNATLTGESQYVALGSPSYIGIETSNGMKNYYYIIHDTSDYNGYIAYNFKKNHWGVLQNTRIKFSVNNILDRHAPLASNDTNESGGAPFPENIYGQTLAPGRFFAIDIDKKF